MRILVLIITLIFPSLFLFGNSNFEYAVTKKGITIICGGAEDSLQAKKDLNHFLDLLLSKIEPTHGDINILIQTTSWGFERLKYDTRKEFIFVSYDTLLKRDTIYLEKSDILRNQQIFKLSPTQTWMYNSAPDIDNFYTKNDVGLKIKYVGYDADLDFFDRLIAIVCFSLENISKIKNGQQYYSVDYFMETGMKISLLSFDTVLLNKIPKKHYGFDDNLEPNNNYSMLAWLALILASGILIFINYKFFHP